MSKIKRIIEIDEELLTKINEQKQASIVDMFEAIKESKPYDDSGDCISREALKKSIKSYADDQYAENEYLGEYAIMDIIDKAPAVDISGSEYFPYRTAYFNGVEDGRATAIPKGEWINHRNDYGHNIADCSLCGKTMQWHDEDEDGIPRYCWYCGAKMKGGAE